MNEEERSALIKEQRRQLVVALEDVVEQCNYMINRLKNNQPLGLGGILQNSWDIFYKLGQLHTLTCNYLFEEKE